MGSAFYMKVAAGTTGRIVIIIPVTSFMCRARFTPSRSIIGIEAVTTDAAIIAIMIGMGITAMEMDGVTTEVITINS